VVLRLPRAYNSRCALPTDPGSPACALGGTSRRPPQGRRRLRVGRGAEAQGAQGSQKLRPLRGRGAPKKKSESSGAHLAWAHTMVQYHPVMMTTVPHMTDDRCVALYIHVDKNKRQLGVFDPCNAKFNFLVDDLRPPSS
jgi:hypothetical protein